MGFLHSRDEQLTAHLRGQILHGELADPLPSTRAWAKQLGVGSRTLQGALHRLAREGVVTIKPRQGIAISGEVKNPPPTSTLKTVRVVYQNRDYSDSHTRSRWGDLLFLLAQRLQAHGIQLTLEKCTDARLRAISRGAKQDHWHELLLLRSLSEKHQHLFQESARPSLVFGHCAPGIYLPYVNFDLDGAIRHATRRFSRLGYSRIFFLINQALAHGVQRQQEIFLTACQSWARRPIHGEVVTLPLQTEAQFQVLRQFSSSLRKNDAVLAAAPVPLSALITTLLKYRGDVFSGIGIVSVGGRSDPPSLWPPPVHYNIPVDSALKVITHAAVHFFETGVLPRIAKTIPLEIADA